MTVMLDPTLINKKALPPDKHVKATFVCKTDCTKSTKGVIQVKMLSRGQLSQLFGRSLAYAIVTSCHGVTQTFKVTVFIDQKGHLSNHR